MRKQKLALLLAVILALVLVGGAAASLAFAPSLSWWTLDGGGGQSAAGSYTLNGTIGQPDASAPSTGGAYSLSGGYWAGAESTRKVFLPIMKK